MPKLTELPVNELLESFAAPTATPGGGSASALAGAVGASLLVMVAAMPKTRRGTDADRAALDGVLRPLRHSRDHLAASRGSRQRGVRSRDACLPAAEGH